MKKNPEDMDLIDKYSVLLEQFNIIGGYEYENKIHAVMS
jgi:hypothetical protein